MISEKIIVIDDDNRVLKSLKMALSEYEIISFKDGYEAINFFQKPRDVHCVILDVMMPGVDGLSVLEHIKKNNHHTAVIMITAYGTKDVIVQALQHHADDFLEKPFDMDVLKEKIRGFLRKRFYLNKNTSDRDYKIERIKSFIQRNYNTASLDLIAEEMCLSPKYISRMFKEKTGMSYRTFHVNAKMSAAKELLKDTAFSIDQISYKLGYQNPESFMRIFKRFTKETPSEYRQRTQKINYDNEDDFPYQYL